MLLLLALLMSASLDPSPCHALDTLAVGLDGRWYSTASEWSAVRENSRYLSIASDSIWMWDVSADGNLSTGIAERGGGVIHYEHTPDGETILTRLAAGELLYDGDASTALDPDLSPDLGRTTPVLLDLGGSFQVNRIRLFPRLDRVNRHRYLQEFDIETSPAEWGDFVTLYYFNADNPNVEPVLDRRFASRTVRRVRIVPSVNRAWEIAELEVYGDGTVPVGEYQSKVLTTPRDAPVWGKVRYESGDITTLPAIVRTRTGTDSQPLLYYLKDEEELLQVSAQAWQNATPDLRGPIKDNPAWSPWQTLDQGRVTSPPLRRYFQFRVEFRTPGVVLRRLVFEVLYPPLARDLAAEIGPSVVTGGEETTFTLSLVAHLRGVGIPSGAGGFRQLRILTTAEIVRVQRVLVDDKDIVFTYTREPGSGFTVNLWQRVLQDGSFVQIVFRGVVFLDQTEFEVRALDRRSGSAGVETVYQLARADDVALETEGGSLTVRLAGAREQVLPLITRLNCARTFTPNADGVNDAWTLTYDLLKLIEPAPVHLSIRDLAGHKVFQAPTANRYAGHHTHSWGGVHSSGRLVAPGLYLYELRVESDQATRTHRGVVGVVY